MHIKLVSNDPHPQFEICDTDRVLVRLRIDILMDTLRINTEDNRRVFFISEEKLKRVPFLSLLNEYSQPLGSLVIDANNQNSGELEIEGKKFHFSILSQTIHEIVLYNSYNTPVISCRVSDGLMGEYKIYLNYFLFALGWYAFLATEKKQELQMAMA